MLKSPSKQPTKSVASQTSTGVGSTSLGDVKGESVSFGIDTKIANGKTLTATGPVIVQNDTNSLVAFQIQTAAGDNLLVADTQNNKVGIGAAPDAEGATLQVSGGVSASGAISADGGSTSLSNSGLRINNILICTSSGCSTLAAQAASGQVFTGDADTLNNQPGSFYRNASNISSGTLNDNRLSNNVALLNAEQTFSGINAFTAAGNTFVGDGSGLSAVNAARLNGQVASFYTNAGNLSSGVLSDARLSGNVTKQGNTFNGADQLVQLDSSGLLPVLDASALTNLNASAVTIGTIDDGILSTNVTLAGNSFNGSSQLVKTNASGDLPALSGINLTNINASAVSTGTVNDLRLSPNVTLQGNTFNGASQLVQLTAQAYFPALNGSLITNIVADNIASGFLDDARLSANVALLGAASQTFSGNNTFSNVITAPGLETTNSGHVIAVGFSGVAAGNLNYNFDNTATPGTYTICTTAGNCSGPAGGVTTSGGTTNKLAKFSGAQTLADSIISDDGSTVTVGGDLAAASITQNSNEVCDVSGNCAGVGGQIGGSGTSGKLALFSGASTIGDSIISQSGTTIGIGGNLDITGQYQLNGVQISSAALSDAADIAMLNADQTFTGAELFTGTLQLQPASDSTTALLVTNHDGDTNVLTVDTSNGRVGVGTQPGYTFDVDGDINISSGSAFRINGVAICGPSATCAPSSGSSNYIQNSVSQQTNANVNIQSVNSGSVVATFRGAASQTADLIRGQDGDGNNVFIADATGNVNITGQYEINGSPICTTSGCTAASGSGSYIQNGTGTQTANFNIQSAGSGSVAALIKGAGSQSVDILQVQDSSANQLLTVGSNGYVGVGKTGAGQQLDVNGNIRIAGGSFLGFGPSDSLKIQDAGSDIMGFYTNGTLQASIDASGNFILSGNGLLVMGIKTSDPTCTDGAVYYNSSSDTFRGCANGLWSDFSLYSTPAGTVTPYAGSTPPTGYLIADGSAVSRTTYSALFAVIGTTYGAGDGSTTFNLPDLRGRDAVGLGTNTDVDNLGDNDGSVLADRTPKHNSSFTSPSISRTANVLLNDPGHTHSASTDATKPGGSNSSTRWLGGCDNCESTGSVSIGTAFTGITVSQQPNFALSGGSVGPGGSRPMDTAAYLTLNYIIKY
jgi:microcystin-dependent protein